ncbi:uncharacterized protein DEA37_0014328 [Paragonimus westermani]|uniref:SH3 domain-containing protein n=1 Tax=Paragonimus westermani TaxID=34504 RepID=A0A5J4NC80_9TREM|nr:uncharacterized protein DEA37_0014328 [Paragonimus westermani]
MRTMLNKRRVLFLHWLTATPTFFTVDNPFETVDSFTYLGSTILSARIIADKIAARAAEARVAFVNLCYQFRLKDLRFCCGKASSKIFYVTNLSHLWRLRGISLKLQGRVNKTTVRAVLLYGSETWPLRVEDVNRLQVFDHRCLRSVDGIGWHQRRARVKTDRGKRNALLTLVKGSAKVALGAARRGPPKVEWAASKEARVDSDWWFVEHVSTGNKGYVPTAYIAPQGSVEAEE